jgi:ABC-2 type transport system ATP-binding protein
VALRAGAAIHELRTLSTDLESLYFELTTSPENRNRNLEGSPAVQDAEPRVRQGVGS